MQTLKVSDYNRQAKCGYTDYENCEGWYDQRFYKSNGMLRKTGYVAYSKQRAVWAKSKAEAIKLYHFFELTEKFKGIS